MMKYFNLGGTSVFFNYELFNFLYAMNQMHLQGFGIPPVPDDNDSLSIYNTSAQTVAERERTTILFDPPRSVSFINTKFIPMKWFNGDQFIDSVIVKVEKRKLTYLPVK